MMKMLDPDSDRLQDNPSSASAYGASQGVLLRLTMSLFPNLRDGGNKNASLSRSPSVLTELFYAMAQKRGWQASPMQGQVTNILVFAGHTVFVTVTRPQTINEWVCAPIKPDKNRWQRQPSGSSLQTPDLEECPANTKLSVNVSCYYYEL